MPAFLASQVPASKHLPRYRLIDLGTSAGLFRTGQPMVPGAASSTTRVSSPPTPIPLSPILTLLYSASTLTASPVVLVNRNEVEICHEPGVQTRATVRVDRGVHRQRWPATNPVLLAWSESGSDYEAVIVTPEQMMVILNQLSGPDTQLEWTAALLHAATALRPEEAFGLKWADLEWMKGRIHIRRAGQKVR